MKSNKDLNSEKVVKVVPMYIKSTGESSLSEEQLTIFDAIGINDIKIKYNKKIFPIKDNIKRKSDSEYFQIQNRRYLGNKYKLLRFIEYIIGNKCRDIESFCDIFAGTGVVGNWFNGKNVQIISNDLLYSNYVCLKTFLGTVNNDSKSIKSKVIFLNSLRGNDNYFSENFGNRYFSLHNAKKIGQIRETIDTIAENNNEKHILISSLIYAIDRIANTVGHYDAFRNKIDFEKEITLKMPDIKYENNRNNLIYSEDANNLIKKINCDVLYLDPPYNSRQYSDAYHLLENLAKWEKPPVYGKAKKMDRSSLKSEYCLKSAPIAFNDLINNANCNHILVSYNSTAETKDGRSNARISDEVIIQTLSEKGKLEIFEQEHKAYSAGRSSTKSNYERIFYCKVED